MRLVRAPLNSHEDGIKSHVLHPIICLTFSSSYVWGQHPVKPDLTEYQYFAWRDELVNLEDLPVWQLLL